MPTAAIRATPRPRIGCAGWSIPAAERDEFAPGASVLARYATRFDVVEINSSFHRPHRRATYERWAASVPADFRFVVKAAREVTHERRLQKVGPALDALLEQANGLGTKLGGLLVQLPPGLAFDAGVAARFFAMLRRRCGAAVACEPRHPSWFGPHATELLQRYGIARVAADPAPAPEAANAIASKHWRYWRWHGSPRIYYSPYDEQRLQALACELLASADSWCILDNTAAGHAIGNALRLKHICEEASR